MTGRHQNLYAALLERLGLAPSNAGRDELYAVACRPVPPEEPGRLDTWVAPLAVGAPLPSLPLWLEADLAVPLPLEMVTKAQRPEAQTLHMDAVMRTPNNRVRPGVAVVNPRQVRQVLEQTLGGGSSRQDQIMELGDSPIDQVSQGGPLVPEQGETQVPGSDRRRPRVRDIADRRRCPNGLGGVGIIHRLPFQVKRAQVQRLLMENGVEDRPGQAVDVLDAPTHSISWRPTVRRMIPGKLWKSASLGVNV